MTDSTPARLAREIQDDAAYAHHRAERLRCHRRLLAHGLWTDADYPGGALALRCACTDCAGLHWGGHYDGHHWRCDMHYTYRLHALGIRVRARTPDPPSVSPGPDEPGAPAPDEPGAPAPDEPGAPAPEGASLDDQPLAAEVALALRAGGCQDRATWQARLDAAFQDHALACARLDTLLYAACKVANIEEDVAAYFADDERLAGSPLFRDIAAHRAAVERTARSRQVLILAGRQAGHRP